MVFIAQICNVWLLFSLAVPSFQIVNTLEYMAIFVFKHSFLVLLVLILIFPCMDSSNQNMIVCIHNKNILKYFFLKQNQIIKILLFNNYLINIFTAYFLIPMLANNSAYRCTTLLTVLLSKVNTLPNVLCQRFIDQHGAL